MRYLCRKCSSVLSNKANSLPLKTYTTGGDNTKRSKVGIQQWNEIWKNSPKPFFHYAKVHKYILTYHSRLFKPGETGRIFLPLCGKTLDMLWLEEKGHVVVGVDCSETGIQLFYDENHLQYEKLTIDQDFNLYKCLNRNISIFCGDFFKSNKRVLGQFDAIWDRGSYTAVNIDQRNKYAAIIKDLLKPNGKYLLSSANYDATLFSGPPHYVDEDDIAKHFRPFCTVELLDHEDVKSPVYGIAQDQLRLLKPKFKSNL